MDLEEKRERKKKKKKTSLNFEITVTMTLTLTFDSGVVEFICSFTFAQSTFRSQAATVSDKNIVFIFS